MSELCSICDEYYFETLQTTSDVCDHKFCSDCIKRQCETAIDSGNHEVLCLAKGCKSVLAYRDVCDRLSHEMIAKFDRNIVRCAEQRRGLECARCSKMSDSTIENDRAVCEHCHTTFCAKCCDYWYYSDHDEDHDCEYDKIVGALEEVEGRFAVGANLKRCPKCSVAIFKFEGCSSVKCAACRRRFCFDCMKEFPPGSYDEIDEHMSACSGGDFRGFNDEDNSSGPED